MGAGRGGVAFGFGGGVRAEGGEFVGAFAIAGVDGADGEENEIFEGVAEEARDVERAVEAEAVVAVDEENRGAIRLRQRYGDTVVERGVGNRRGAEGGSETVPYFAVVFSRTRRASMESRRPLPPWAPVTLTSGTRRMFLSARVCVSCMTV